MGVACGSSTGSTNDVRDAAELLMTGKSDGFNANTYVRMMPHTTAANIGIFFGLTGRIIPHLVLVLLAAKVLAMLMNQLNMV